MGYFKDYLTYPAIESTNILRFHNSIPEAVAESDAGATDDTEVEDMVLSVVVDVVGGEDVVEGDMVITHINFPAGTEHLCQNLLFILHING